MITDYKCYLVLAAMSIILINMNICVYIKIDQLHQTNHFVPRLNLILCGNTLSAYLLYSIWHAR